MKLKGLGLEISQRIVNALKKRDEPALRIEIIRLMDAFLQGKVDKYEVDLIASNYLNAEFFWEECKGYEIQDAALRAAYEALAAADSWDDKEALTKIELLRKSLT